MITIVITRNLPARFCGFLSSCMLEITPGTFITPHLTENIRNRIWEVIIEWQDLIPEEGGLIMIWEDHKSTSGISLKIIGWPKKEILEINGIWLTRGKTDADDIEELKRVSGIDGSYLSD